MPVRPTLGTLFSEEFQLSLSVTADGLVGFALIVHSLTAPTSCSYSALAEALRSTALDTLPKRDRRQSGWFEANVDTLRPLIAARNVALGSFLSKKTPESITQRASTRAALQTTIRAAKSVWLLEKCSMINYGIVAARGTSTAWKTRPLSVGNRGDAVRVGDGFAVYPPQEG